MIATIFLILSTLFCESKNLALQIHLDRAGYSCSAIDGVWGKKSERMLKAYLASIGVSMPSDMTPAKAYDRYFAAAPDPFKIVEVTQSDLDALVKIPAEPADKAALPRMGYESIKEMFAERGHLSQIALTKLNPGVDWDNVIPGLKLVIPDFPSVDEELLAGDRNKKNRPVRPEAALVKVSISAATITALDADGKVLAMFPCSIAANKAKVPPHGELKITAYVARPNYTYTPDEVKPGEKLKRYVYPEGENCPVGVAWMGLNLPGYGMHGTPIPESIGYTGSHGCFRLANWNAARLYAMTRSGTPVIIEP